jgi:hypothetical protein
MKRFVTRGGWVVLMVVLTQLFTASAQTVERSLEEFLAAQGTFCFPDGLGGCFEYLAPLPNMFGGFDADPAVRYRRAIKA